MADEVSQLPLVVYVDVDDTLVRTVGTKRILLDDQPVAAWRRLVTVHPAQCESESVATYRQAVAVGRGAK